jgi:hypothetical protein
MEVYARKSQIIFPVVIFRYFIGDYTYADVLNCMTNLSDILLIDLYN